MDFGVGDYFGERALIKNEARAASVVAETDVTLLKLNRRAFKRLFGPIKPLLVQNMRAYNEMEERPISINKV
jgi:cAMP-dependent protein kinase regulator